MLVVGIAGGTSAGKTTVRKLIEKHLGGDVLTVSLAGLLREYYKQPEKCPVEVEKNDEPTKHDLAELGNKLREKFCDGILVKLAVEEYSKDSPSVLIIEGIRTLGEASQLITLDPERFKTFLIYVTATKEVRKRRWKERGTKGSFEKIYRLERKRWKTQMIRKIADYVINNNGPLGQLNTEVAGAVDIMRQKFLQPGSIT